LLADWKQNLIMKSMLKSHCRTTLPSTVSDPRQPFPKIAGIAGCVIGPFSLSFIHAARRRVIPLAEYRKAILSTGFGGYKTLSNC
jgi:hypothetical protein